MPEIRINFHDELGHLRRDVVRLGALVAETIPRGTEALLVTDFATAASICEGDERVDRLASAIESDGCRMLALQQPVASDLRHVITALRLAAELERIGDLMVNVVSILRELIGHDLDPRARGLVEQLGELTHALLCGAIDAYADGDANAVTRLARVHDEVTEVHRRLTQHLLESARGSLIDVDAAVQVSLVGRSYERIGEHAFTVGERVRYMVKGAAGATKVSAARG